MSIEVPGSPPSATPTLWVHEKSGNLYEVIGFGTRESTGEREIQYWDGETVWHRPVEEFDQKFKIVGVL